MLIMNPTEWLSDKLEGLGFVITLSAGRGNKGLLISHEDLSRDYTLTAPKTIESAFLQYCHCAQVVNSKKRKTARKKRVS